ncbi:hypothetical protein BC831DRAFT_281757 [Entophlyctis helioformis]|nr:hypothetical protein BC831DRAFT_281757 [Entophlyctis helioformis]
MQVSDVSDDGDYLDGDHLDGGGLSLRLSDVAATTRARRYRAPAKAARLPGGNGLLHLSDDELEEEMMLEQGSAPPSAAQARGRGRAGRGGGGGGARGRGGGGRGGRASSAVSRMPSATTFSNAYADADADAGGLELPAVVVDTSYVLPKPPLTKRTTGLYYDTEMLRHALRRAKPAGRAAELPPALSRSDMLNMNDSAQTHAEFDEQHFEQPVRVSESFSAIKDAGLLEHLYRLPTRMADVSDLGLVHSDSHLSSVDGIATMTNAQLDRFEEELNDTYLCNATPHAAKISCGGAIAACEAVWANQVSNAIALVRPPGHHAEEDLVMGFCIYNNVAVAARRMQTVFGVQRIMIVDWDIHHGNGTQKHFYNDPNVLFVSIHRFQGGGFFPHQRDAGVDFTGGPDARGRNINIPWVSPGMCDADYIRAFQDIVMPVGYEFQPDLVIVSAGFDAAEGDPIGECHITPTCFAHMTHMLKSLANGRVVLVLEGGYHIPVVKACVTACTSVLLGMPPNAIELGRPQFYALRTIRDVKEAHSKYWTCFYQDGQAEEPHGSTAARDAAQPPSLPALPALPIPLFAGSETVASAAAAAAAHVAKTDMQPLSHDFPALSRQHEMAKGLTSIPAAHAPAAASQSVSASTSSTQPSLKSASAKHASPTKSSAQPSRQLPRASSLSPSKRKSAAVSDKTWGQEIGLTMTPSGYDSAIHTTSNFKTHPGLLFIVAYTTLRQQYVCTNVKYFACHQHGKLTRIGNPLCFWSRYGKAGVTEADIEPLRKFVGMLVDDGYAVMDIQMPYTRGVSKESYMRDIYVDTEIRKAMEELPSIAAKGVVFIGIDFPATALMACIDANVTLQKKLVHAVLLDFYVKQSVSALDSQLGLAKKCDIMGPSIYAIGKPVVDSAVGSRRSKDTRAEPEIPIISWGTESNLTWKQFGKVSSEVMHLVLDGLERAYLEQLNRPAAKTVPPAKRASLTVLPPPPAKVPPPVPAAAASVAPGVAKLAPSGTASRPVIEKLTAESRAPAAKALPPSTAPAPRSKSVSFQMFDTSLALDGSSSRSSQPSDRSSVPPKRVGDSLPQAETGTKRARDDTARIHRLRTCL